MQELLEDIHVWALKMAYKQVMREVLGHEAVVRRLERGYDILVRDSSYVIRREKEKYYITSENDTYEVDLVENSCNCPDSQGGFICKHRLALRIVQKALSYSPCV